MRSLSEKEKDEKKTIRLKITLPTKEAVIKALAEMLPGIEIEEEEEKPSEKAASEE